MKFRVTEINMPMESSAGPDPSFGRPTSITVQGAGELKGLIDGRYIDQDGNVFTCIMVDAQGQYVEKV